MISIQHNQVERAGELVIEKVCQRHDCTPEELLGPTKPDRIVAARQMAFWLLRLQGYHYPQIGEFFSRNHVAVIHGCIVVNHYFDVEPRWRARWPEYAEFRVASNKYTPVYYERDAWV